MIKYLNVVRAEISRVYADQLSHFWDSVSWIIFTTLLFSAVVTILGSIAGGAYTRDAQLAVMVGWLTFQIAGNCMMSLQDDIASEAATGTLEQVALSPVPLVYVFLARSIACFFATGALGLISAVLLMLLVVGTVPAGNSVTIGLLFVISAIGAYGLGFGMAGAALVFKQVSSVAGVVFSLMIFLTGSLVGLEEVPVLFEVTRIIFPLTWGISLMRDALSGTSLEHLMRSGQLIMLIVHSVAYLLLGLLLFSRGYRKARIDGSIAHY